MMGGYADTYDIGWMWMGLGMLLFWGAFIWFIVWLIQQLGHPSEHHKTPLIILKEQYAKGEISHKEYERRRKHLEK